MKKRTLLLFLLILVFCLSACGETSQTTDKGTTDSTAQEHTHDYTDATCTQPATCSCGRTKGSALGHDYSEATCTTPKVCNRCQTIASSELGHDYTTATCTAPQICKRCEDVIGTPLGHEYEEATCLVPTTCTRCQATKDSALGHTYVDNKCIRCENIDPESLPVAVDKLHVIDSGLYSVVSPLTDTYGYTYDSGIKIDRAYENGGFVTYNLAKRYTKLTGSIVVPSDQSGTMRIFMILVDDVCVFSVDNINRETAKIDFSIDIKNATKLKFECKDGSYGWASVAIVNAEVQK